MVYDYLSEAESLEANLAIAGIAQDSILLRLERAPKCTGTFPTAKSRFELKRLPSGSLNSSKHFLGSDPVVKKSRSVTAGPDEQPSGFVTRARKLMMNHVKGPIVQVLNLVKEVEVEPDSSTAGSSFQFKALGGFRTRSAVRGRSAILLLDWRGLDTASPVEQEPAHSSSNLLRPRPLLEDR